MFSTCLATLSTCGLVVDGTAVGKDNNEEKIREVAVVRMYHFDWNFLHQDVISVVMLVDLKVFNSLNKSDKIKVICVGV